MRNLFALRSRHRLVCLWSLVTGHWSGGFACDRLGILARFSTHLFPDTALSGRAELVNFRGLGLHAKTCNRQGRYNVIQWGFPRTSLASICPKKFHFGDTRKDFYCTPYSVQCTPYLVSAGS